MSRDPASWIIQDRVDMTDWVLHFVHETNLENEPTDDVIPFERYDGMAYHEDPDVNNRFSDWDYMDEYQGWGSGASAFGVLRKIISDGHIRSTWAFRKDDRRYTDLGPLSVSQKCLYMRSSTTPSDANRQMSSVTPSDC